MTCRKLLLPLVIFLIQPVAVAEPLLGPVIADYGPTYLTDEQDLALPDGFAYKAVFDLAEYPGGVNMVNRNLESVARYLNMHARNGVSTDAMDLAIVVHGPSVKNLLNDEAYRARHRIENPNLALLLQLQEAGVTVYVCGQSMAFGKIARDELADGVKVALSAMTMFTILQAQGYALIP